jgi:hypothetical protein
VNLKKNVFEGNLKKSEKIKKMQNFAKQIVLTKSKMRNFKGIKIRNFQKSIILFKIIKKFKNFPNFFIFLLKNSKCHQISTPHKTYIKSNPKSTNKGQFLNATSSSNKN